MMKIKYMKKEKIQNKIQFINLKKLIVEQLIQLKILMNIKYLKKVLK